MAAISVQVRKNQQKASVELSKSKRLRIKKVQERKLFMEQYNIYGRYVTQEERDIDRAITNLTEIITATVRR